MRFITVFALSLLLTSYCYADINLKNIAAVDMPLLEIKQSINPCCDEAELPSGSLEDITHLTVSWKHECGCEQEHTKTSPLAKGILDCLDRYTNLTHLTIRGYHPSRLIPNDGVFTHITSLSLIGKGAIRWLHRLEAFPNLTSLVIRCEGLADSSEFERPTTLRNLNAHLQHTPLLESLVIIKKRQGIAINKLTLPNLRRIALTNVQVRSGDYSLPALDTVHIEGIHDGLQAAVTLIGDRAETIEDLTLLIDGDTRKSIWYWPSFPTLKTLKFFYYPGSDLSALGDPIESARLSRKQVLTMLEECPQLTDFGFRGYLGRNPWFGTRWRGMAEYLQRKLTRGRALVYRQPRRPATTYHKIVYHTALMGE